MKQRTIIHFMRHGQVVPVDYWYGRLPNHHLSEKGISDIKVTRQFFVGRPIHAIYAGPLERAQEAAKLVEEALFDAKIMTDERITEIGLPKANEGASRLIPFIYPTSPGDGETAGQILERMHSFIEDILIHRAGKEVIAVTHGAPIELLLYTYIYGKEPDDPLSQEVLELGAKTASINSLVFYGRKLSERWYSSR